MNGLRAARSPDRTRWVFPILSEEEGSRWTIRAMPGGAATRLPLVAKHIGSASWLSDGRHILLSASHQSAGDQSHHRALYLANLATVTDASAPLAMTRVTFVTGDDNHAVLSPDGKWLAFVSTRAEPTQTAHHVYVARWRPPAD